MLLLHVGEERTTIADATLALGWHSLARDHFRHDPPSPLELENAIAAVEDEVARAHQGIARGAVLVTDDSTIRRIAVAAGVERNAEITLARGAVEQAFERLASRAPGLPAGGEFAATLLILRELMHHLDFPSILIRA
jgi:hypothetical protein